MAIGERPKILLIDDDERFLEVTERRLGPREFKVATAQSWVDAIPHLREPPDLVLLDVRMVSLSGARLCSLIKERHPHTAVVFYSSEPEASLRALTFEHGADGYLSKSADRAELVGCISATLRARAGKKAPPR
ncbi:MAG TPA: response regulator [Polyangiaceae bacterium]|nr:response regulator [Polyangiaceae bacterium]